MQLSDIVLSISRMTDEQLAELVMSLRGKRAQAKMPAKAKKKARKNAADIKAEAFSVLSQLSIEELDEMIAALEN